MNKTSLKTIIHHYVETSDEKILKVVHTILEQNAQLKSENNTELCDSEIIELDKRWDKYINGLNKTYTIDQVKREVNKQLKLVKRN